MPAATWDAMDADAEAPGGIVVVKKKKKRKMKKKGGRKFKRVLEGTPAKKNEADEAGDEEPEDSSPKTRYQRY